jgi:hypothetical protein
VCLAQVARPEHGGGICEKNVRICVRRWVKKKTPNLRLFRKDATILVCSGGRLTSVACVVKQVARQACVVKPVVSKTLLSPRSLRLVEDSKPRRGDLVRSSLSCACECGQLLGHTRASAGHSARARSSHSTVMTLAAASTLAALHGSSRLMRE